MPKASKAKPTPAVKRFEARLERLRSSLNWIIIRVPFDAAKLWGTRGQIKVKGEINGFVFRTSLFPTREGGTFCWSTSGCKREREPRKAASPVFRWSSTAKNGP